MKEEITLNEILSWIALNCDNTEAMDKINRITYQFTQKFKEVRYEK